MITYRELRKEEINQALFSGFQRRQEVTQCFRKIDHEWMIVDHAFTEDWTKEDIDSLIECLIRTLQTEGFVLGAFIDDKLKGFVSVERKLFGKSAKYMDLSSIHVSQDKRGLGIGKALFLHAKSYAKKQGAQKLYISAHSAVESQAFYRAMGCVEALEYDEAHTTNEPCDCQLECQL